jgi:MoaA/NifB/PqqE/SkfB family radical SAM enzyme
MKKITGLRKYLVLFKAMMNRGVLSLPVPFIFSMMDIMRHEKLTMLNGKYYVNTHFSPFPSSSFESSLKFFNNVDNGIDHPMSVYFSVTDKCINKCIYCSNYKSRGDAALPVEKITDIIKNVQDSGAIVIGITGGEPLLREDLEDIIASVDKRSYTILFTSGSGLTAERVQALKRSCLTVASVSIDSLFKDEQVARRGSDTAYEDALKAIKFFSEAGIYTTASAVMNNTMQSWRYLEDFADFCYNAGAHELRILREIPSGKIKEPLNNFDLERIEELKKKYNKRKDKITIMSLPGFESPHYSGCNGGLYHMYIDAEGNLCPCDFVQHSFGNLNDKSFSDIYTQMKKFFPVNAQECLSMRVVRGEPVENRGETFYGLIRHLKK